MAKVGLGLLLALAVAAPAAAQEGRLAGLDAYVRQAMEAWEVPGLAIAVVRNDTVIYAQGYGVREVGTERRVTPETVFAIGSTSKAFTATAVGLLVDQGEVEWDGPAQAYLPWFEVADPFVTRELTVRDLLTHRSGLAREDVLWYGSDLGRRDVLGRAGSLRQEKSLRTGFLYNNIAYIAAGEIIAEVSGRSWDAFVEERIFAPLGMRTSSTSVRPLAGLENVARPHAKLDDRIVAVPYRDIDNAGAASSINSSALEMAAWVRLNLGDGTFEGRRILEPATLAELHEPAFLVDDPFFGLLGKAARARFMTYALGWAVQDFEGERLVWHGGNIDGMSAAVGFVPSRDIGAVVLSNMNQSFLPLPLLLRVLDQLTGGEAVDWAAEFKAYDDVAAAEAAAGQAAVESARVAGTAPSLPLEAYAGAYEDELYGGATVSVRDGGLWLRTGAAFEGPLEHWHYDTFRVTWEDRILGRGFVTFDLDARGEVATMDVGGQAEFVRSVPEESRR